MHWKRTAQRSKGRPTANWSAKKWTGGQTPDGGSILSRPLRPLWEGLRRYILRGGGVTGLIKGTSQAGTVGGWAQGPGREECPPAGGRQCRAKRCGKGGHTYGGSDGALRAWHTGHGRRPLPDKQRPARKSGTAPVTGITREAEAFRCDGGRARTLQPRRPTGVLAVEKASLWEVEPPSLQ